MSPLPDGVFRAIVERTGAPFVIIDLSGVVVFASETVEWLLGWAPSDLVDRNIADFLRPEDIELALSAIAEIDSIDRAGAGVPVTLPVATRDGRHSYVEVAALPLYDLGIDGLIALRLRVADAEHHLTEFVRSLVSGGELEDVLVQLTASIAADNEASGTTVHWGFDGTTFAGIAGSWPGARTLALDESHLVEAMAADGPTQVGAPPDVAAATGATTGWLLPVRPSRGPLPALIAVWRTQPDPPYLGHRRALLRAADYLELALVRADEHERLLYLAAHDSLTGTSNRAAFTDALDTALARGETNIAVGYGDLDGFKQVNDRFGHGAGDAVLTTVADRIRSQLRVGDEVARIGGDEFTILWRNVSNATAATAVAQRVVDAVRADLQIGGVDVRVGISFGIVLARPGADGAGLLRDADAALYEAKHTRVGIALAS